MIAVGINMYFQTHSKCIFSIFSYYYLCIFRIKIF